MITKEQIDKMVGQATCWDRPNIAVLGTEVLRLQRIEDAARHLFHSPPEAVSAFLQSRGWKQIDGNGASWLWQRPPAETATRRGALLHELENALEGKP